MNSTRPLRPGVFFILAALCLLAANGFAQPSYDTALKNLRFRSIGPAVMGGRMDDFAVVESDPRIIYLGAAAGGLFKTVNGGQSWQALFEDQPNPSIGDIALAPSNPSILYVGTGEANNRQSSSWGDGVYKSMDAGATWTHMGLKETHHIGRIVVHPTDPNIVYVAALGDLWGPNKERGVFKSTDGGATLDADAVHQRRHRRLRYRHRSAESQHPLRGRLSAPAHGVRLQRRRSGQRHLSLHRWRAALDQAGAADPRWTRPAPPATWAAARWTSTARIPTSSTR